MTIVEAFITIISEHTFIELVISIILCIGLGVFSYWRGILDAKGAIAAFVIGITIAIFTNIYWLITLICFLFFTYLVTKLKFNYKQLHGVAQGKHGERSSINVIANGTIIAIIAILRFQLGYPTASLLYICCISVAASDSFANEVGILSKKVYLITDLNKQVKPGTDGGISKLGEGAALAGAFIPAIIGWFLISEFNNNIISITDQSQMPMNLYTLLLPITVGLIGCQIDSLLGATLQRKKLLSNDAVNFFTILICVIITGIIIIVMPL